LIASCAVVASHYLQYLHLPHRGFHLAVDLFFVISGVVIAMIHHDTVANLAGYGHFIRKRIARLYPLHLATLAFYILIGLTIAMGLATPDRPDKYNSHMIVPNLLMIHAWSPYGVISYNYVSWSISAEFFVYLCFPVLLALVARGFWPGLLACIGLLASSIACSELLMGTQLPELNWTMGALRAVPSFSFGIWLSMHRDRLASSAGLRAAAPIMLPAALAVAAILILRYPSDYPLLTCMYVIAASAFVCDIHGLPTLVSPRPLSSRGYLTYSIYMLHTVVATMVISFIFPRLFGSSGLSTSISVATSIALTYLLAVMSYRYFETPARAFLSGRWRAYATLSPDKNMG
jgi:peptidoglycan/LPS O-acetylase OafA/YrhL